MHTHGLSSQPGRPVPVYDSWRSMIGRCYNRNDPYYSHYGGLGIRVCEQWKKFENFFADMGHRPKGMTLGRISLAARQGRHTKYHPNQQPGNRCMDFCRHE